MILRIYPLQNMAEEIVDIDTTTDEEEVDIFEDTDDVDAIKEQLAKKDETNKQLYVRMKKAEGFEIIDGKWVKPQQVIKPTVNPEANEDMLSQKDMMAFIRAGIDDDDISVVTDYAKLKGITVSEALNSTVIKGILAEKEEERRTAQATSTGNTRKGSSKPSPTQLLEKAKKGEMPESDEDMAALVKAQFENK